VYRKRDFDLQKRAAALDYDFKKTPMDPIEETKPKIRLAVSPKGLASRFFKPIINRKSELLD
jgi:hypothetical protein